MSNIVHSKGFTLVELMLSIAILLGISGIGAASYVKFNEKQTVQQAAMNLKSDLRSAQSKALSGEKSTIDCGPDKELLGWCASTNPGDGNAAENQSAYEYYGVCADLDGTGAQTLVPFPDQAVNENYFRMPNLVSIDIGSYDGANWLSPADNNVANKVMFSSTTHEAYIVNKNNDFHDILSYCIKSVLPVIGGDVYVIEVTRSGEIMDQGFMPKCRW